MIEGDRIVVDFKGKAGKPIKLEISDRLLARVATKLLALKGRGAGERAARSAMCKLAANRYSTDHS